MEHDIVYYAKNRHTVKAYDNSRKIPAETVEKLKELLQLSPSSTNSQPWHFILASTDEGKERVASFTKQKYAFNRDSILNASHVVVFASRLAMTDNHLSSILEQEDKDGRFDADTAGEKADRKASMHAGRSMFINLHKQHYKDVQHWMDKQVYLNIGQFLLGVSALGLSATPMEGIDIDLVDEEFGLREKGYTSLVVVTVGYNDPEADYNAALPKSRLPLSYTLTEV